MASKYPNITNYEPYSGKAIQRHFKMVHKHRKPAYKNSYNQVPHIYYNLSL
ncbi:hypothetical protein Hanom_Chr10g00962161 [Helianthus anomalus]